LKGQKKFQVFDRFKVQGSSTKKTPDRWQNLKKGLSKKGDQGTMERFSSREGEGGEKKKKYETLFLVTPSPSIIYIVPEDKR